MKMDNIIEIEHLYKSYGDVKAVNDLSFKVKSGEFFALLGVNGAGKSTTIAILCGTLKKDSGTVKIDGKNVDTDMKLISKEIGVVFQNSVLDANLTVKDNLYNRASLYGIYKKEADEVINRLALEFDFKDLMNRTIRKLSGGQRRRIDVARALISSPKILILDEPTTGLDPQTRKKMWEIINDYRKNKGLTVLLTTHYMEETIDANYIVILDSGKISAEGTPIELKNKFTGDFITVYGINEEVIKDLNLNYEIIPGGIRIEVKNTQEARDLLISHPGIFTDFEITKGKMDDVFLVVTGKNLGGGN